MPLFNDEHFQSIVTYIITSQSSWKNEGSWGLLSGLEIMYIKYNIECKTSAQKFYYYYHYYY